LTPPVGIVLISMPSRFNEGTSSLAWFARSVTKSVKDMPSAGLRSLLRASVFDRQSITAGSPNPLPGPAHLAPKVSPKAARICPRSSVHMMPRSVPFTS
jgi:hypothetical protein